MYEPLVIYCDGSSLPHPRKGGTGIRFVTINDDGYEVTEDIEVNGYLGATNNQMELQACIQALEEVIDRGIAAQYSKIIIRSDSDYVVSNNKNALNIWYKNHWFKTSGAPVLNADLWKRLVKCQLKIYQLWHRRVEFIWVKGHAKDTHNKAVDKLAKKSAKSPGDSRISIVKVRRKKFSDSKVEIGSVGMLGQRITIYIVNDEYLREQKIYKYRYQVVSRKSPYYKKTDFIYSKILLQAGHTYSVRFCDNKNNPTIEKLFREVEKTDN